MSGLVEQVAALSRRIAELERRVEGAVRKGKVMEVDEAKGLARIEVGRDSDGTPQAGPWVRYSQVAGALKIHTPPTVGQTMMQVAPGGEFEQAALFPLGFSDSNESPGRDENPVITFGALRLHLDGQTLTVTIPKLAIQAGGSTFNLTDEGLKLVANLVVEGEAMTHNDHDVGFTHRHPGVRRGDDQTDPPA